MEKEELHFLIQEYITLWKDYGVEPIKLRPQSIEAFLRKQAQPPVAERPSLSQLDDIRGWLGDCHRCGLCEGRTKIVFGAGDPKSSLLFVGEAPGADEDKQGIPFVGKAGQLLTKIIQAMESTRDQVYITNIVKCRPAENRAPESAEIEQCLPFLKAQIEVIRPKLIVALGTYAATTLIGSNSSISNLRGRFHRLQWNPEILVMPTYHPAYLLRNPNAKRLVWEDMKLVKSQWEGLK